MSVASNALYGMLKQVNEKEIRDALLVVAKKYNLSIEKVNCRGSVKVSEEAQYSGQEDTLGQEPQGIPYYPFLIIWGSEDDE